VTFGQRRGAMKRACTTTIAETHGDGEPIGFCLTTTAGRRSAGCIGRRLPFTFPTRVFSGTVAGDAAACDGRARVGGDCGRTRSGNTRTARTPYVGADMNYGSNYERHYLTGNASWSGGSPPASASPYFAKRVRALPFLLK